MKTLKDFDYDLWTSTENGKEKYWVRVKRTGEVCEVDITTMRELRKYEKQMRRAIKKHGEIGICVFSLDCLPEESKEGGSWEMDTYDLEEEVYCKMTKESIYSALTEKQKGVFKNCMLENKSLRKYAKEKGLSYSTVRETRDAIRKKAAIVIDIPAHSSEKCPLTNEGVKESKKT